MKLRLTTALLGTALIGTLAACGSTSSTSSGATGATAASGASGASGGAVLDKAAAFEGTYSGTWTNTTFGSSGPAKAEIKVDKAASKATLTLTLGGSVFGGTAPGPITIPGTISATGFNFSGTIAAFGATTITVAPDGTVDWSSSAVPSARVKGFTAKGTIDAHNLNLTGTVTFKSGEANASDTIKLAK